MGLAGALTAATGSVEMGLVLLAPAVACWLRSTLQAQHRVCSAAHPGPCPVLCPTCRRPVRDANVRAWRGLGAGTSSEGVAWGNGRQVRRQRLRVAVTLCGLPRARGWPALMRHHQSLLLFLLTAPLSLSSSCRGWGALTQANTPLPLRTMPVPRRCCAPSTPGCPPACMPSRSHALQRGCRRGGHETW